MSVNEQRSGATTPPSRPAPSAGDVLSRVVFGGFWSVVTVAAVIAGVVGFSHGEAGLGFGAFIVAVLTGLYARYIFRGGRFRILFW